MPFPIPNSSMSGWDIPLGYHLGQLINPVTGGINTWVNSPTVGVDNKPLNTTHEGYTGYNQTKQVIERWNGTVWVELNTRPTDEESTDESWEILSSTPYTSQVDSKNFINSSSTFNFFLPSLPLEIGKSVLVSTGPSTTTINVRSNDSKINNAVSPYLINTPNSTYEFIYGGGNNWLVIPISIPNEQTDLDITKIDGGRADSSPPGPPSPPPGPTPPTPPSPPAPTPTPPSPPAPTPTPPAPSPSPIPDGIWSSVLEDINYTISTVGYVNRTGVGQGTLTATSITFPGSDQDAKYQDACTSFDGRIFLSASDRNTPGVPCLLYNPTSNTHVSTSLVTPPLETNGTVAETGFSKACLSMGKLLFFGPRGLRNAYYYNASMDVGGAIGGSFQTGTFPATNCSIALLDGRIFFVGLDTGQSWIYNPDNSSFQGIVGINGYMGAVLMPNGKIFFPPCVNKQGKIYDPSNNTTTNVSIPYTGTYPFVHASVMADGRIFIPPYDSSTAVIFNPSNNTTTQINSITGSSGSYSSSVLLPDGTIFVVARKAAKCLIFDPSNNSVVETNAGNGYMDGLLTLNGEVFLVGREKGGCHLWDYGFTKGFPVSTLTSPFINN